jgi:nitrous oxide reductase
MMTEIIDTLSELKRMHQLNFELLEQLSVSCNWLMEHKVPIPNAEKICSLLNKAKALANEIQAETPKILQYRMLSDESKQPHKPDDKVTEPIIIYQLLVLQILL